MLSPLGLPVGAVAVVEQRGEVRLGAHEHPAANPPITAVRPPLWYELLSAERGCARSTGSGEDVDGGAVNEHPERPPRRAEGGGRNADSAIADLGLGSAGLRRGLGAR